MLVTSHPPPSLGQSSIGASEIDNPIVYQAHRNILLASSLHLPYFGLDSSLVGRNVVLQLNLNLVERLQSYALNQLVIGAHFLFRRALSSLSPQSALKPHPAGTD